MLWVVILIVVVFVVVEVDLHKNAYEYETITELESLGICLKGVTYCGF